MLFLSRSADVATNRNGRQTSSLGLRPPTINKVMPDLRKYERAFLLPVDGQPTPDLPAVSNTSATRRPLRG